jgi:hypothetical protein
MDLISTITVTDIVLGTSLLMVLGTFGSNIALSLQAFWQTLLLNPAVGTLVNSTLVLLKNTEVVWRPVLETSLVVLKPIAAFALAVLRPFGPYGLVVLETVARSLILLTCGTAYLVLQTISFVQSAATNVTVAVDSLVTGAKDFVVSLATVLKGLGQVLLSFLHTTSFIVKSFESVATFGYRILFETSQVTWEDLYSVSIPLCVVASIVGYILWRSSRACFGVKSSAAETKCDVEDYLPRRSSRIARKRAMMFCSDSSGTSLESPASPPNL